LTPASHRQSVIHAAQRKFFATMKPSPSPADTLQRVIKVARLDGLSIFVISGGFALITLVMGDLFGTFIGLLVAAAGWSEWHGAKLLQRRRARGINWLVRSQCCLLGIILLYVMRQLISYDTDLETVRSHIQEVSQLTGMNIQALLESTGLTIEDTQRLVQRTFYAIYGTVGLVTFFYQGGLALYYRRRIAAVHAALDVTNLVK
jgi:hypothetical protein